ncbi:hypothetical protein [Paenibacillus sedimenti]|uniref:Uncharacterized protein n=1 Tax=Paenibacillus sedimenti TaxID=2770274 RepID=A0A926KP27_9BACL|nr:hypothetical protein [Paenibacillus sedimenti]MBD0380688.1 hypothetical protein [Paenibacillus sedimenti]
MIIDYCEKEITEGGRTQLHMGLQFEDEPDSLYVAELELDEDGSISEWKLFYNGFDCGYAFRPEEKEALILFAAGQGISIHTET